MSLDTNDNKHFQQTIKLQPSDNDDNNDIIILDDDDFIQTTLSLLEKLPKPAIDCGNDVLQDQPRTEIENQSILIDLTSDFDLNDLFQMHENSSNNNNHDAESVNATSRQTIKNEFDFKVRKIWDF